jgi:murein DD-endopeptidase MepM/ murein hydrolase activator NlpD
MSSPSISYQRLAGLALLGCLAALVLASGLSAAQAGTPTSPSAGQLRQQISAGQNQVSELSGTVDAAGGKITALSGSIASLQEQIAQTQTGLYAKRAVLLSLRDQGDAAQAHLVQLQSAERAAQATLGQQLVGMYEGDAPDVVSVVLESSGFSNMLDRLAFVQKVDKQDARIMSQVQASRRTVAAQATTLAALSVQQQKATLDALNERNRLASAKLALVKEQLAVGSSRDRLGRRLVGARNRVASVRRQLAQLEGPVTHSGGPGVAVGRLTFPMPKSDVAPSATWSLDDGVDIAAPSGTPELAVCSGAIVLHGIGGFGPSAPVLHCDSPLAGHSYVYYGHAGPGHWVPVGTHVRQGQVISEVGAGIVGISTGPHLELGFADSSGSPIGPSSAGQMMSLLRASY